MKTSEARLNGPDGSSWTVVETVSLDGRERIEGLQVCEDAIRTFRDDIEDAEDAEEAESTRDAAGDDAT